jgi:hypothetical protein
MRRVYTRYGLREDDGPAASVVATPEAEPARS